MAAQKTKKKATPKKQSKKIEYTIAKSDNGTIQINFSIPYALVEKERDKVIAEMGKNVAVPGFRKGKAPLEKVAAHVDQNAVVQRSLSQILPEEVGKVIQEEKLKPAIYPKFELMKAMLDEPWEVRAVTCELPEVKLGDYKKELKGAGKASAIWTPGKDKEQKAAPKEATQAEKEQVAIQTLLKAVKINIPQLLIEEEVNAKLSQLLDRIEKLGLNLESYLKSVGKDPQTLRGEYEVQAKDSISLDLILSEIVNKEKISVDKSEVDKALEVSAADPEMRKRIDTPEQRRMIESILRRRKALDSLISLL